MRLTITAFLLLLALTSHAQSQTISIRLSEKDRSPVVGATVGLTDRADTTRILHTISDSTGESRFSVTTGRQYLLEVRYSGFQTLQKVLRITASESVFRFTLNEDPTLLDAVTIKARKPLMRQEDDKTIVDPEPIVNSSTSVYEVMEKTPGLYLDQDGNVYLNSATPATIYINGREQKMSAQDLASILKSLPPNSIDRMEILRTPSAKYDASGSGGIVNIVLKKGVKIGRTGSVYGGFNQGTYGNQYVGGSLNHSDGGNSSFLNVNFSNRNSYDRLLTNRLLGVDSTLSQDAYTVSPGQSFHAGGGLGFEPAKNWELNLDTRLNLNQGQSTTQTRNRVTETNLVLNDNVNDLNNDNRSWSLNQGLSAKCKFDTLGSEITVDLSYNYQQNGTDQDFTLLSVIPESVNTFGGLGDIANHRHFFSAQTDFKYKFPKQITLESGAKTTWQRFSSATEYSIVVNGSENPDPFRTNSFDFDERIHAAYLQASKTMGAFILKAGSRLEHTDMFGRQSVPSDTSFRIRRTDLFPYVYFSRKVMNIAGYDLRGYLVYRRSISRPSYSFLNPFPKFLDQYLYEAGNPSLRPQFTDNYEFNISFNEMPILAVGKNYTTDIFTNVVYEDPELPGVAYRTYDNLGKNEETYFRAVGALPPGGAYFFVLGAQYNRNKYNGLYQNEPLSFSRGSWRFFTYQQLKLGSRSTITMHGFWILKGQMQFYELSDFGGINLSINRQFLDKKLTITLSANDVFFTNRNRFNLAQGTIEAFGERSSDTRRFGLNVRYNFGFRKKEDHQNMFNEEGADKNNN